MNIVTLYVNSKDRTNPLTSSTNFIYNLFPLGIYKAYSYFVKSVAIPLSNYVTVYPPISGTNQTFELVDFLNVYTISIPSGNYTAQQLATEIQTQLNSVGALATYSVSYSTVTNKITISATSSYTINFATNNARYSYQSIGSVIGFRDVSRNPINITGSSSVAPFEVYLSGPLCYYIKSNALTNGTNSFFQGKKSSVIACIPNSQEPFGVLTYLNQAPIYEPLFNIQFNQLDFRLVDEYDNDVILNDDWVVTISVKCDA